MRSYGLDNCELARYLSGRLDIAARFRSSGSREDDKAGRCSSHGISVATADSLMVRQCRLTLSNPD